MKYSNESNRCWGWIGIFYKEETPEICMGFKDNPYWGEYFINLIRKKQSDWKDTTHFKKPYFDSSILWFDMSEDLRNNFESSESVDEQKKILTEFMDKVLLYPFTLNPNNNP